MADILLQKPQAGQTTFIAPQTDDRINLEFSTSTAELSRNDDNLVFTFSDGSAIELTNFYTAYSSENMPEFIIEGNIVPGESFFATLGEELMPAAGTPTSPQGSGSGVGTEGGTLLDGIDAREGADSNRNNQNDTENTTTFSLATGEAVPAGFDTGSNSSNPDNNTTAPITYAVKDDVLSTDAGSSLKGNLLENDNLPTGATIATIEAPEGWDANRDPATGIVTFSKDGTSISINQNGDYELDTKFQSKGVEDVVFKYVAQDQDGNNYEASITVGNAGSSNLYLEKLQGKSTFVQDLNTGNSYEYNFSNFGNDTVSTNQHIKGMLLGEGSDTITIDTAIGSQGYLASADSKGEDTFIYGDFVNAYKQEDVNNDIINIGILDGTKIRADGHLHNDVVGGNDTINVETMEHGSIIGDGWNLHSNSVGGDDEINIGTMHSGEIYSDARALYGNSVGGDDQVNIGTIDTNLKGSQTITINTASGDDTVTVENIEQIVGGDKVNIDGGLGRDIFIYDNDDANTITMSGTKLDIDDNGANIFNFEGISTGGGDDLIKLAGTFDDVFVDGGNDMDVLLANFNTKGEIEDMINDGNITNTEMIVLNNSLNTDSVNSSEMLFDKLEDEGVTKDENGNISLDAGSNWTKGDSIGNFDQYTNADNDMTIFIAKTQVENPS